MKTDNLLIIDAYLSLLLHAGLSYKAFLPVSPKYTIFHHLKHTNHNLQNMSLLTLYTNKTTAPFLFIDVQQKLSVCSFYFQVKN